MAKYIDADEVYEQLCKEATRDSQPRAIRRAAKMVIEFPAADVAPVRHGRWEQDAYAGTHCSECLYVPLKDVVIQKYADGTEGRSGNYNLTLFCPNCGADMRDGEAASDEA